MEPTSSSWDTYRPTNEWVVRWDKEVSSQYSVPVKEIIDVDVLVGMIGEVDETIRVHSVEFNLETTIVGLEKSFETYDEAREFVEHVVYGDEPYCGCVSISMLSSTNILAEVVARRMKETGRTC